MKAISNSDTKYICISLYHIISINPHKVVPYDKPCYKLISGGRRIVGGNHYILLAYCSMNLYVLSHFLNGNSQTAMLL